MGGSSYIDSLILMDADTSGDSTLETRQYILQNWRADVAVIVQETGSGAVRVIQWNDYDAYGRARSIPWIDFDFNGDDGIDDLDTTDFLTAYGLGDPAADINRDDAIDDLDTAAWFAGFSSGDTIVNEPNAYTLCRMAYSGYVADGYDRDLYHVRHRVYDVELGRWTRRDPLGYVDGMSVYEYCTSQPYSWQDPNGLMCGSYTATCNAGPYRSFANTCQPADPLKPGAIIPPKTPPWPAVIPRTWSKIPCPPIFQAACIATCKLTKKLYHHTECYVDFLGKEHHGCYCQERPLCDRLYDAYKASCAAVEGGRSSCDSIADCPTLKQRCRDNRNCCISRFAHYTTGCYEGKSKDYKRRHASAILTFCANAATCCLKAALCKDGE